MRTNLLFKSSVDGDILQVFWITRNLESLRKKTSFLQKRSSRGIKCRGQSENKVSRKEKVAKVA